MTTTPLLARDLLATSSTRSGAASALAGLTVGVEEEFLLLDPVSGRPVPAAPALLGLLAGEPGPQAELMRFQFETATRVCTSLAQLRGELTRLRRLAATGAETLGCRLVASGIAPYGTSGLTLLTDRPRYRELARRYPRLTAISGTCACHVHVGVPSRDVGVQVLARLRPWLAPLLAISANSPIDGGRDTGWASRRYRNVSRWPTARPPALWPDAIRYDGTVRRLIAKGAAIDDRSIYFLARLSPHCPTVEVRVADVCPDIDTALLVAALIRALVATALTETEAGAPLPIAPYGSVIAGLAAAARHGLAGTGVDPFTGEPTSQRNLLHRLLNHVGGALDATGDRPDTDQLLTRLDRRGTGAERQRTRWTRTRNPTEFVQALSDITLTDPMPIRAKPRLTYPPAVSSPGAHP
ncbi:MAG TPA: glutamate--cysteine ligase [Micromonosporaceae bacterium]